MTTFDQPAPIPVFVLTGFLGAGKTTLLNQFLTDPATSDTAVIVNEFGEVSIDHDLVRIGETEVMVTTTGCLCCSPGSDIRTSLFELMEARRARQVPQFRRVVVETTGLADPAPVVNQLVRGALAATSMQDHRVASQFALKGVICAVDAVFGPLTLQRHFESMKQVALADRIVITKGDMTQEIGTADVDDLHRLLREVNAASPILERHRANFDLPSLFVERSYTPDTMGSDVEGWLAMEAAGMRHSPSSERHSDRHAARGVGTQSFVFDEPLDPNSVDGFLSILRMAAGSRLLRLKGIVALRDDPSRPVILQAVQHAIHPSVRLDDWPSDDHRTRIVAITTGIEPEMLASFFDVLRPKARASMGERMRNWSRRYRTATQRSL